MLKVKMPYRLKLFLISICIFLSLLAVSCQDDIVLPKQCTEEPNLPFTTIRLHLYTDILSERSIFVDSKGHIIGDSLLIKRNNNIKSFNIAGYICKDGNFYLNSFYNDTTDNSIIKIEGTFKNNNCPGKIYFCPNQNNNCTYSQIGFFSSSYSGNEGRGSFYTPLFSGELLAYLY